MIPPAHPTEYRVNPLGQPIGLPVAGWRPPPPPSAEALLGRYCRVERLDPALHAEALFAANRADRDGRMWTYLACGPFDSLEAYRNWVAEACASADPLYFAIVPIAINKPAGVASYLRIFAAAGTIEIGGLAFSPGLQRTAAATEALYLMIDRAFAQGYRRCEWKCDALNAASRSSAHRLGFSFEGIFRQATVYKQRNRDTAWYAMIDRDWPSLREAFRQWLDPSNFDEQGRQRTRLRELRDRPRAGVH